MRKSLTILFAGAMLSALFVTSGCVVSKSEYDRILAQNKKAMEQVGQLRGQVDSQLSYNKQLQGEIGTLNGRIEAKDSKITMLESEYGKLKGRFDKLHDLYQKAAERDSEITIGVELPIKVDRALRTFAKANPDLLEYLPKYGMVKLKSDLSFSSGSAIVRPGATKALGKLAEILKTPAASKLSVYIAGHTDNVPIGKPATRRLHPTNWHLSAHRAIGVQKVLIRAAFAPKRIAIMGFGEYQPIAPNKVSDSGKKLGNQINRRVEIWIVPANRLLTQPTDDSKSEDTEK